MSLPKRVELFKQQKKYYFFASFSAKHFQLEMMEEQESFLCKK